MALSLPILCNASVRHDAGGILNIPVTVVIPVKNEQSCIERCLDALKYFTNVVVVDSNSEDKTVELASCYQVEILNFNWNGQYPKKRNWYLTTKEITTDWVLFLDADEIVNEEFCVEVNQVVETTTNVAFWITYKKYFMGKELKHGIVQRKLALIKVDAGLFERVEYEDNSDFDMEIHEHPIVDGEVGTIRTKIDHMDDRGLSNHLEKHLAYAKWECYRYREKNSLLNTDQRGGTSRQSLKYRFMGEWWFSRAYFLMDFVFYFGWLDGVAGYRHARLKERYFETIRMFILESNSR